MDEIRTSRLSGGPATLEGLSCALEVCARPDALLTALHLALPSDVAPQLAVRSTGGVLSWREVTLPRSGDLVVDALLLAHLGARQEDRWLDLSADRAGWVKPVRSGRRTVVFGSSVVLGLPVLVADAALSQKQVLEAVVCLAHGQAVSGGMSIDREGRLLVVKLSDPAAA